MPHLPRADQPALSDRRARDGAWRSWCKAWSRRRSGRFSPRGSCSRRCSSCSSAPTSRRATARRHHAAGHRDRPGASACGCRPASLSALIGAALGAAILYAHPLGLVPRDGRRGHGPRRREDARDDRRVPRLAPGAGSCCSWQASPARPSASCWPRFAAARCEQAAVRDLPGACRLRRVARRRAADDVVLSACIDRVCTLQTRRIASLLSPAVAEAAIGREYAVSSLAVGDSQA